MTSSGSCPDVLAFIHTHRDKVQIPFVQLFKVWRHVGYFLQFAGHKCTHNVCVLRFRIVYSHWWLLYEMKNGQHKFWKYTVLIVFMWSHILIGTPTCQAKRSFAPLTASYFYTDCIKKECSKMQILKGEIQTPYWWCIFCKGKRMKPEYKCKVQSFTLNGFPWKTLNC